MKNLEPFFGDDEEWEKTHKYPEDDSGLYDEENKQKDQWVDDCFDRMNERSDND